MLPLTPEIILSAYREGLFPMGDPFSGQIEWYRPDPRAILPLKEFHLPRRLARTFRSGKFEFRSDADFEGVIDACAAREVTWITPPIREAYAALHRKGSAHSVEAWRDGVLVGGLYGVHVGGAFMAESMFHRMTDAGKVAVVALVHHLRARGFLLLDIQMMTPLLRNFGAVDISAKEYQKRLDRALKVSAKWRWNGAS